MVGSRRGLTRPNVPDMSIEPDTKDWTWVVATRCDECGLESATFSPADYGRLLREAADRWVTFLAAATESGSELAPALRTRPDDRTWAPLEYACHVRDVVRKYDHRLQLMTDTDDPHYPNWDQDETAVVDRYLEQDPAAVAAAIAAESAALADRFDAVTDWTRTGNRSDGARFTIESFGRYFLHDVIHHLYDVGADADVR